MKLLQNVRQYFEAMGTYSQQTNQAVAILHNHVYINECIPRI